MDKWGVVLALALSACAVDSDSDPSNREPEPIARRCGPFGCLQNTATGPDDEVFDELDASGKLANADGVRIESFTLHGGIPAKLHAIRDRLVAYDSSGNVYEGDALDGAVLILSKHDVPAFEAEFAVDTTGVAFWGGDTSETAEVYDILVRRIGATGGKSACRNDPPMSVNEWPGNPYAAVVFEGDRYDHDSHTVSDSTGSTWFNIACAGGYPAKLHLLRHTWAGSFSKTTGTQRWETKLSHRQVYLRAITADYHGNGDTYTRSGVPLLYGDAAGIYPMPDGGTVEAIWNENGAICLNDPRIMLRAEVDPTNEIPWCPGHAKWFKLGYVLTAIP